MKVDNFSCFDPTMKLYGDRIRKIRARSKKFIKWRLRNISYTKRRASSLRYDILDDLPITGWSDQFRICTYPLSRKSVSTGGRPLFYASRNANAI